MKVGWIGLGRLGLPAALVMNVLAGHRVIAYDVSDAPARILTRRKYPHREARAEELLDQHTIQMVNSVAEVVDRSEVVFVAVQTPHEVEYGGETPAPAGTGGADFDYTHLKQALASIADCGKPTTVVVVSTTLPGTIDRELLPMLPAEVELVYNPFFISLGTVIRNMTEPEFVLVGCRNPRGRRRAPGPAGEAYDSLWPYRKPPFHVMSYVSAELAKMAYNVRQGMEIALANHLMEISAQVGAHVDDVTRALSLRYGAGMVDGGACRPRDLIAMSHLEAKTGASTSLIGSLVRVREAQAAKLARLVAAIANAEGLPVVVLGRTYKPGTDLTVGAPAALLGHYLARHAVDVTRWDPHLDDDPLEPCAAVFVVATRHPEFQRYPFPPGSTVVDPWGYIPDQPGATVVRVGRKP